MSVEPTNAFKNRLAEHIRTVAGDPRARVLVGARRRPEAVLMSPAADVPASIRKILLAGSVISEAAAACRGGRFSGVGDDAGAIVGWLWAADPDEAAAWLAAVVAQITARAATVTPEAVLESLPDVLPADMPRAQVSRLLAAAKRRLPAGTLCKEGGR